MLFRFLIMALLLATSCIAHASSSLSPLDSLARLPEVGDLKISPDGDKYAYTFDMDGSYMLVVRRFGNSKEEPKVFALEKGIIRGFNWANNERVIFTATVPYYSQGDYETFTISKMGLFDVNKAEVIWPFKSRKFNRIINAPEINNMLPDDDKHVLVSSYYLSAGGQGQTGLFKVNLKDGSLERTFSRVDSYSYQTNRKGELLYLRQYNAMEQTYVAKYRTSEADDFISLRYDEPEDANDKVIEGTQEYWFQKSVVALSDDAQSLYYYKRNGNKIWGLVRGKVKADKVIDEEVVADFGAFDLDRVTYDAFSSELNGAVYIDAKVAKTKYLFDLSLAQVQADLEATFPEGQVIITSYSKDRQRYIAKVSSYLYPEEYFFYDQKQGQLGKVAGGFPGVDAKSLGRVSLIHYKVADGSKVPAYVTVPQKAKSGDKLPLIVLPHGGPETRDDMSFDYMRQFFAASGYMVLQPNFRGSSGYGKDYAEAGYGQWGALMQQDVDDGVRYLIEQGQVDPQRICVFGASYGGYVAMYSAAVRHDLYRCAVSYAGVSDLDDMFYHTEEQLKSVSYWEKSIGERSDQQKLKNGSPLYLLNADFAPLLLIHGDKDTVVPSFQSNLMYKKAKGLNRKKVKYVEIEGADHWLSKGDTRRQVLGEALQFVEKHIGKGVL